MPTVTLKGMSQTLYEQIKSRARQHGLSLNQAILACLGAAASSRRVDPEFWLKRSAAARKLVKGTPTDADLET